MATRLEAELAEKIKQHKEETAKFEEKIAHYNKIGHTAIAERYQLELDIGKEYEKQQKFLKEVRENYSEVGDKAREIGNTLEGWIQAIPGGTTIQKVMGLENLGKRFEDAVIGNIQESFPPIKEMGKNFKFAFGPVSIAAAVLVAIVGLVIAVRKEARKLGQETGLTVKQAKSMLPALKASEFQFKMMGLDSSRITTTLSAMTDEFGSLENVTVKNAANISRMAQNLGTSGKEVVTLTKAMMDLTGSSFDVASNMAETAAQMAKTAGVAAGKVISDMSANAEAFAKFSMDGAEGLAKAAVEAAKIGGSLSTMLTAADSLLKFESSLTAQFKAQVLTGKMINTERARQLALEGDIAGLTFEVQDIIGGIGDLQSLNVIQRQSIADAIGITVRDLQRISRGEQMEQQETVQDKLDITNQLLASGNKSAEELQDILNGGIQTKQKQNLFQ